VALVSLSDFDILERLGRGKVTGDFGRLAARAARVAGGPRAELPGRSTNL